jgi:predicted O-methyltransferase YrrM
VHCDVTVDAAMDRPASSLVASIEGLIARIAATSDSRVELWSQIVRNVQAKDFLELGVLRGRFAEQILRKCPGIGRYYMLDPWERLDDWNKPTNHPLQSIFDEIHVEAMTRTEFAKERRIVLRGKTTEVIDRIPDEALDVAYVDGDHTLRGITIDLIRTYPKVRPGGILGGDDYSASIWHHPENFEPTLVCPFAAYFAESHGAPIIILPYNQFAIIKPPKPGAYFHVTDTTNSYGDRSLLPQITKRV